MTLAEPPPPPAKTTMLVGLWLRSLADGLDAALLALLGFILVLPFREEIYRLGDRGWWLGAPIAYLYAGLLHTRLNRGQSVAKWLLGIQVVRRDGTFMSLPQSLLRYSIINFLFFESLLVGGLHATFPALDTLPLNVAVLVVGVFVFCGVVFLVPLHPLKQGLHDLLVDTVVVRRGRFDGDVVAALWNRRRARRAWALAIGVFLLIVVLGAVPVARLSSALDSPSATTAAWQRAIESGTALERVYVGSLSLEEAGHGVDRQLVVAGFLASPRFENASDLEAQARRAAEILASRVSDRAFSAVTVNVVTGFNVGIAQRHWSRQFHFPIDTLEPSSTGAP
ncbi:MAG TPA: RDD family protein [Candidatus Eisenbacteria bacterium]|nr:RDD family protein [Candidatus Eisenbacteria bacterium]